MRFRWHEDGTLLARAGHRMTNERLFSISPDGVVERADVAVPPEGMVTPKDATDEDRDRIQTEYRAAWRTYADEVTSRGLDFDHGPLPADLRVGADEELWRLDDGEWRSEPLRAKE